MLLAKKFKAKLSQAKPNQTKPSQSIAADGDGPSQVTIKEEGTKFLERVHNCTDREDAVVRALKELNTGKGWNGKKRMAWYFTKVGSMSPQMVNSDKT